MELLKAELLATMSHELRSPLTSIRGYASTLLRHERRISREERHEFLLAILEASDHLASSIDSLLEMSEMPELETEMIELEHPAVDSIDHAMKERSTMPVKKTMILTADDDPQLLRLVARNLEFEDYHVLRASDGKQALDLIEQHRPDAVLLDVMMPRMDGFTVCQRVREFSTVPIILLTARGQDQDKVRGLDLGADDYLTKPFSVDELLARVRAVLRRSQFAVHDPSQVMRTTTTIGDLSIDFTQHLVTMAGREIPLTPVEYRLLSYLT